ncbi:hypothetical protein EON62_01565 [archaeon]|nr:MAG: hypothetical protein EON62_01565 [archaeon]
MGKLLYHGLPFASACTRVAPSPLLQPEVFESQVLPKYFKHNNIQSFARYVYARSERAAYKAQRANMVHTMCMRAGAWCARALVAAVAPLVYATRMHPLRPRTPHVCARAAGSSTFTAL